LKTITEMNLRVSKQTNTSYLILHQNKGHQLRTQAHCQSIPDKNINSLE
jgi:hypothetical protein